jgi:outer membrane biosynthesis protein TonB
MRIGLLTVSLLLASAAFAREEDSPLTMDEVSPKIEKPVLIKPSEDIVKPKLTTPPVEAIKVKPPTSTDEAPKKKTVSSTDETPKKKTTSSTDETPKKKTEAMPTIVSVSALAATATTPTATEAAVSQRQQQSLIDNAEKIDSMNRELLTQNQTMQLANEKLAQQVELLQNDRSSEYMRNGAFFVVLGLFLGWLLSNMPRQRKKW